MRVAVAGYRHYRHYDRFVGALQAVKAKGHWLLWIDWACGDSPEGPEKWLRQLASPGRMNCSVIREPQIFRADWRRFGREARMESFKAMINEFQPAVLLAFVHPQSDDVRRAADYAAGAKIEVVYLTSDKFQLGNRPPREWW